MPHQHRRAGDGDEETDDERRKDTVGNFLAHQAGAQIKCVFDRTDLHARQAAHALVAPHAFNFVYTDACRTSFGAKRAINAGRLVADDFERTQPTQHPEQSAVGTKIAAPKVFDGKREQHENEDRPQCEF